MRQIGHLENETAARTFGDFLYVQGIQNQLEHEVNDGWAIWIHDEEHLSRAKEFLAEFRARPNDPRFAGRTAEAEKLREKEQKAQASYEKRLNDRRHLFRPLAEYGFGPLTFVLIAVSVVVFFLMKFGQDSEAVMGLFITKYVQTGSSIQWLAGLQEVRHGEVWRLLTPIFLHFGFPHILFNMLALRDLGSMIEGRHNSFILALLVVVFGIGSNFAEYVLGYHPNFGGMSGVLYGLFGYIWIRGKFDPGSGLYLHPTNVLMMLVWFVLCWVQIIPNVANIAHTAGLVMGMAWAWLSSLRRR